ncbi:MAG: aldo/keto reductase [Verrucomicrobia bacterium]|nr:aldo/keto reductase [Verrucomicrobiota bacterium]
MKRRSFLKFVGGVAGSAAAAGINSVIDPSAAAPVIADGTGMPRRALGRTGLKVSIVGFPGFSLKQESQERCTAAVHEAFKRGVNYFDVAPAYANGECENKLGVALQGLDRSVYHLACKTKMRDADGCRVELERSLQRLKTEYFDVYQLHHLVQPADVKKALAPGGAMEAILKAKEQGKVRFIGFSAHTTKAAVAALMSFPFDTVMFPINYVEYFNRAFGKEVLDVAQEKGAGVLAIKPMNAGLPKPGEALKHKWWYRTLEDQEEINMAWRFTLSLPGVGTGFSPAWLDLAEKAINAGYAYRPITESEIKKLMQMAEGQGSIFKREEDSVALNRRFDSPYPHHPHECDAAMWG